MTSNNTNEKIEIESFEDYNRILECLINLMDIESSKKDGEQTFNQRELALVNEAKQYLKREGLRNDRPNAENISEVTKIFLSNYQIDHKDNPMYDETIEFLKNNMNSMTERKTFEDSIEKWDFFKIKKG